MGHCESKNNMENILDSQNKSEHFINNNYNFSENINNKVYSHANMPSHTSISLTNENIYSIKRHKIIGETYLTDEALKIILQQKANSICKIYKENKAIGTGFLCIISNKSYNIPVLFTCNHVLNEKDVTIGKTINLTLNDDKVKIKIKIDKLRKIYTSNEEKYDSTIIEIRKEDGFDFKNLLQINNNIFINKSLSKLYKDIYILHYPEGFISAFSHNIIKNIDIDNNNIQHLCATEEGSSGAPILCLNNYKVIGYHVGQYNNFNSNLGKIISGPIDEFIKLNRIKVNRIKLRLIYEDIENTEIECDLNTKIEDIFKEYSLKIGGKLESLFFLTKGSLIDDYKKSLFSLMNESDKDKEEMVILVYKKYIDDQSV